MPDTTDYTPTFPMYLPLSKAGNPELVEIDGNACLALFTSKANVEKFCRGRHPDAQGWQWIRMTPFKTAADLRDFLLTCEGQFEEQDCRHVAIDAQPGAPPMYAPIRDFVEYLKTA